MTTWLWGQRNNPAEAKTYDAADGGRLTWTTSVLLNSAAPTNGQKFCGLTHQFVILHCGGQKFEINGMKSEASRPALFSGTCRGQPILSPFAAPREQVLCCWKRVCAMTTVFSLQNSIILRSASFCTPGPIFSCYPGVSWLPTFAFYSLIMERTSFGGC